MDHQLASRPARDGSNVDFAKAREKGASGILRGQERRSGRRDKVGWGVDQRRKTAMAAGRRGDTNSST